MKQLDFLYELEFDMVEKLVFKKRKCGFMGVQLASQVFTLGERSWCYMVSDSYRDGFDIDIFNLDDGSCSGSPTLSLRWDDDEHCLVNPQTMDEVEFVIKRDVAAVRCGKHLEFENQKKWLEDEHARFLASLS